MLSSFYHWTLKVLFGEKCEDLPSFMQRYNKCHYLNVQNL